MPGKVVVEVNEEIINLAVRASSSHCMIADAIRTHVPGVSAVSVDLATIRFSSREKGERYIYLTPAEAQRKLVDFDQGIPMKPWTLRLPKNPAQIVKMKSNKDKKNLMGRPSSAGPAVLMSSERARRGDEQPVKVGGSAPPLLSVLSNKTGQRRVFGLKSLRGFAPPPEIAEAAD